MFRLQVLQALGVSRHRQRVKHARREVTARMAWLVLCRWKNPGGRLGATVRTHKVVV